MEVVDVYTRQCAIGIAAKRLAAMSAKLANGGIKPVTSEGVIDGKYGAKILAIMMMAGFYNEAGKWAWDTGLPAKTGVGGGIVAVVPGRFAIVGFSPQLDEARNSVCAASAVHYITDKLGTNLFRTEPEPAQ